MRASRHGRHVSGAERLVPFTDAADTVLELLARAAAANAQTDVVVNVEDVAPADIVSIPSLAMRTVDVDGHLNGQGLAREALRALGVSRVACEVGFDLLNSGPNPTGGNMRGAILMDHLTGARLEPNSERGVRVSRVDMPPADRARMRAEGGGSRRMDALILASKVAQLPCVAADLGWSDDPTYAPGYVASSDRGYVRFTTLKAPGSPFGGRVYFVRRAEFDPGRDVPRLERQPTLVTLDTQPTRPEGHAPPTGPGGNPGRVRVK